MEYGSRLRFSLMVVGGIILLILSIWGVTSLARRVIGGGNKTSTSETVKKTNLTDYNKPGTFVRVSVDGPVVANELHESYQIEVGQNYRELKLFKGYEKTLVSQQYYANNSEAYDVFLKALKLSNFTRSTDTFGKDETGYCARGRRYVYELIDNGEVVQRTWNTSCSTNAGTFTGAGTAIRTLFTKQVPDLQLHLKNQKFTLNN